MRWAIVCAALFGCTQGNESRSSPALGASVHETTLAAADDASVALERPKVQYVPPPGDLDAGEFRFIPNAQKLVPY
jgi:hypothetical protein